MVLPPKAEKNSLENKTHIYIYNDIYKAYRKLNISGKNLVLRNTDGRNLAPVEVGSLSQYLPWVLYIQTVVGLGMYEPSTVCQQY